MFFTPPPIFMPTIAAAPAFAPSDLSGLWLWLKGGTGITLTGGRVSAWADQSGGSHSAGDPGAAGNRPLVSAAAQNGLDAVSADSNDFMTLPNMSALTAATMFCVAKKGADPAANSNSAGPVFNTGTGANCRWPFTDGVVYDSNGSSTTKTIGNPSPSLAAWFIASIRSATSDYEFLLNGTSQLQTAVNTKAFSATPRLFSNGSSSFNGLTGEIVFYSTALSQADRQKVEGYLAWRWAITSVLPVGHPYKLAAP